MAFNRMRMHSVENAIRAALVEAEQRQIRGAAVTPFVLQAVNVLTQGAALRANIALVRNNAQRGSEVAKALATLSTRADAPANVSVRVGAVPTAPHAPPPHHQPQQAQHVQLATGWIDLPAKRPLVVGGAVLDITARLNAALPTWKSSSHPGKVRQSNGGVGRNIAEALARMGAPPRFVTLVGPDAAGEQLRARCGLAQLRPSHWV